MNVPFIEILWIYTELTEIYKVQVITSDIHSYKQSYQSKLKIFDYECLFYGLIFVCDKGKSEKPCKYIRKSDN